MAIDKPSLAALLAQSRKGKADDDTVQASSRPFMLKDPKAIVKELLSRKAKPEAKPDEDDEYLSSLMKSEEPKEEEIRFETHEEPQEDDAKARLRKIMEGK